jgi:Mg-chelatase subunit ChlD
MKLEPGSSTSLFDGLMKALEYAEDLGREPEEGEVRIDTIFLLSDGRPTHFRGAALNNDKAIDAAYETFKAANGARRIVVHAIGVGQGHNEKLMKKLARESGGKYVAVGMD